ncbi:hypothetical protein OU800_16235 [Pseudomonas sp. GOM7]|uniref:hypothetical protein n=1 Tax=Pseudomonas sp. GOM7 TaxID=2998079 RepID=UPI00227B60C9|nr:hypothetical protein [Pseudomonas sp. GOM7]WAJ36160.1 hypothetical protein OU800_16235 [Pseudomonas sp. GOM7]
MQVADGDFSCCQCAVLDKQTGSRYPAPFRAGKKLNHLEKNQTDSSVIIDTQAKELAIRPK